MTERNVGSLETKKKRKKERRGASRPLHNAVYQGDSPGWHFWETMLNVCSYTEEKYAVFADVSNVVFNVWRLVENRPVIKVSSCANQHLNLKFKGKLSKALQKYLKYKTAYPFQYVHLYTGLLHWHPEAKGASKLRLPCSLQRQGPSHYIRGFMTL